uniref:Uncharacterized protein n=1 Tax=Neobodo designis TaxID=312471 RepID=A0A7S1W8V5_NEODS
MAQDAEAHNKRGNDSVKEDRYDDAVKHYTDAINANPAVAKYFSNRSFANVQLKVAPRNAIEDAQRAVSLSPSTEKFHFRLITALNEAECYAAVELYCARFLRLFPQSTQFGEGCEKLADEAAKKDKARKNADKQKLPVAEPPSEAHPVVPEQLLWYGVDSTAYQWWSCFDGAEPLSDRFVDAHRFLVDAFALGCGETKEQPYTAPHLYAFAMQAWRFGQLPAWFSMEVLVLVAAERLGKGPRGKDAIRAAWRESPYHSPHLISSMRYVRDAVTLAPNTFIAPETVVASSPDVQNPFEVRSNALIDYTAMHHAHQWRDRAVPVMREFEKRYAAAVDAHEVNAAIELAIATLCAVLPTPRTELALASMIVFVHWRSAEHALYWFNACMASDTIYRMGIWSRYIGSWVLLLGAYGWGYQKATAPAFVALIWTLCGPGELGQAAIATALTTFANSLRDHLRSSHDVRALIKQVAGRPEGYGVTAAAVADAVDLIK